ncbi:MAG: hypothetical protein HOP17_04865 [Acidobacteria bacterium]|nr:hypothetical protein [Acidobacteriota bacterium]
MEVKMKVFIIVLSVFILGAVSSNTTAQPRKTPVVKKAVQQTKTTEVPKPEERPVTVYLKEGEPVSGKFVDASSEGLHLVVAGNKLIVHWKNIKQVSYTDVAPVEPPAPKIDKGKEALEGAVKSLKKLSTAVEVGINFQEFSRRLIDIKIEYEGYLSAITDADAKSELMKAMEAYEDSKTIWNYMVGNNSMGRATGDLFPDYEPGKTLQAKYSLPTYRTSGLHLMEGDKAMKLIWVVAASHIEKAAAKLEGK